MVSVLSNWLMISVKTQDAFSYNINYCLFNNWMKGNIPILAAKIDCSGYQRRGLCYGLNRKTSFAVCYNTKFLIPEMSGYSVYRPLEATGRGDWRNEGGRYGTCGLL